MSWLSVAIHWTDQHSGAVQAVGTILVAGAGFAAIWWQRNREEKEAAAQQRLQAEVLATRLLPYVEDYKGRLLYFTYGDGDYLDQDFGIVSQYIRDRASEMTVFHALAPHMITLLKEDAAAHFKVRNWQGWISLRRHDPDGFKRQNQEIFGPVLEAATQAQSELESLVTKA